MKIRILVMNGQKLIQSERGGEWTTQKVEKAGVLKPGIYNLYLGSPPDKSKSYEGPIVYVERDVFYQQVGRNMIKHEVRDVGKAPDQGASLRVAYEAGKAVTSVPQIKRARKL